ncbi:MAG: Crp/Fnr family transcriptional regulator [Acidobacteria bacterium]|nr:Crp/Fnr family transcriptional regulator [Acidobacteriota bacterium]MCA1603032.1 Crp/Fnr family transcriptional regulator [Acidobacteriota bacterium]
MIQNNLLAALSETGHLDLISYLTKVSVSLGEVLHQAREEIQYVYFPENCVISILSTMEDGSTVEVGVVGHEGMLGVRVLLGVKKTPHCAVVQVAGSAMRMRADRLDQDLKGMGSSLRPLLLRYTQALLSQISQSVACISQHSIRQRLARWLLAMRDRTGSNNLDVTHEIISLMMGIRRASASENLHELRDAGLIATRRGGIRIVDSQGLANTACECYRIVKEEYDRLYSEKSI